MYCAFPLTLSAPSTRLILFPTYFRAASGSQAESPSPSTTIDSSKTRPSNSDLILDPGHLYPPWRKRSAARSVALRILGYAPHRQRFPAMASFTCSGVRVGGFVQQGFGGQDLPWRAEPALEAVFLDEGLLDGVKFAFLFQPLDRLDGLPFIVDGQGHAGIDGPAFDQNRAGPAGPLVAPLLRAPESQVLAQNVEQGPPGARP